MLLDLITRLTRAPRTLPDHVQAGARHIPLIVLHHPRARRYRLRLLPDGTARVTIPRRGSVPEAWAFVERNQGWLERQFQKLEARPRQPEIWTVGTEIWFRGERVRIEAADAEHLRVGDQWIAAPDPITGVRAAVE